MKGWYIYQVISTSVIVLITDYPIFIYSHAVLGMLGLKSLELSDTEVGSNGLRHLSGQTFSLPLSFPFCIFCVLWSYAHCR